MNQPTAVIAEDEPVLRAELRARLGELWPELTIVAEAADGLEATRAFDAHAPDVLFLDIQMPGMTGLEVARLASGQCHVVFVTAYDRYAVAAFEQGAVDYVMKPFSHVAPRRDRRPAEGPAAHSAGRASTASCSMLGAKVRDGEGVPALDHRIAGQHDVDLITIDEICYFRADNKYTTVVTPDRGGADQASHQGAGRGRRSRRVLADPPRRRWSTSTPSPA